MVNNQQLNKIQALLDGQYLTPLAPSITEKDVDCRGNTFTMTRDIVCSRKADYIVFRIDPNIVDIFPYFNDIKGLKKICDFVIFAETDNVFMVLLIEMKKGQGSPIKQLNMSENFIRFIIKHAELVDLKIEKDLIFRKLGLKDTHVSPKRTTQFYKDFHFDANRYALEQGGSKLFLEKIIHAPVY